MINREITYERDVNKSYMKIPAVMESCLDETLMFRRNYQGILPMEKCYVNGSGQYWYNISGKQALDAYCRVHTINRGFFETLILRICSQLEILEWNLIETSCLVVDPELIFVNHSGEDISFILYPDAKSNFADELQQLMDYLLTKLNHADKEGVSYVYRIYNMMMADGYTVRDMQKEILSQRSERIQPELKESIIEYSAAGTDGKQIEDSEDEVEEAFFVILENKIREGIEWMRGRFWNKKDNKETIPIVVYPEDEPEEETEVMNPTICLAATLGQAKGILIYEGMGDYPDYELGTETVILGKNPRAKLYMNRETISQFHAKFDYYNKKYYIEDMNSTNGTFVNDEMLNYKEKRELCPGDILRFADVKYRFL